MSIIRAGDEDWSIISSSSDMDEERSTTSGYEEEHDPFRVDAKEDDSTDEHDHIEPESSITTLKLPNLRSSSFGEGDGAVPSQVWNQSDSLRQIEEIPLQDLSTTKCETPITRIISFYENLSHNTLNLHNSIKQKSDMLYKHFAKKDESAVSAADAVTGSSEDDDITLSSVVSSEQVQTAGETDVVPVADDNQPVPPSKVMCEFLAAISEQWFKFYTDVKELGIKTYTTTVVEVDNFLKDYSEYLIYFIVLSIVGAGSSYKAVQYMSSVPEPEPTLTNNLFNTLHSMIYEEVDQKSWFGSKRIKQLRFSAETKSLYQHLTGADYWNLFKNSAREYFDIGVAQSQAIVGGIHNGYVHVKESHLVNYFTDNGGLLADKIKSKTSEYSQVLLEQSKTASKSFVNNSGVFFTAAVKESKNLSRAAVVNSLELAKNAKDIVDDWNLLDKAQHYSSSLFNGTKQTTQQILASDAVNQLRVWYNEVSNGAAEQVKSYLNGIY